MKTATESGLLNILVRIVNGASRARSTSASAVDVADVPVNLLEEARKILEAYRDTELATYTMLVAVNRMWR